MTASIHAISFKDSFKFWLLTSAFVPAEQAVDNDAGTVSGFEALARLFEAWTTHGASTSGIADVLRIASATEKLTCALCAAFDNDNVDMRSTQLDDPERAAAAAEHAAQRFRQAHEALTSSVSQRIKDGGDESLSGLVHSRDAAFGELREALHQLEESLSLEKLGAVHAKAGARLQPVIAAVNALEHTTRVKLSAAVGADFPADEGTDLESISRCGDVLQRTAVGIAQHVQKSGASAQLLAQHFLERAEDGMLKAISSLDREICAIAALDGGSDTGRLGTMLKEAMPWDAILRCAARLLAPLRAMDNKLRRLETLAGALRSEVKAFVSGLAGRAQAVSLFEEKHKAVKRARKLFLRLKADHDNNSDDDSDADELDPEELSRQRRACHAATGNRDTAAQQLFLAAKAYYPETLVDVQRHLRLTSLSVVWSERFLDLYEGQEPLDRPPVAHHELTRARYGDDECVLKIMRLARGQDLCKETEVLRCLNHPNIIKLEAAFIRANFLYLHFPYAKHGDLEQYLKAQSCASDDRISADQLCRLARQLCEAVAYLAERNIVHCDVQPANIFVDEVKDGSGAPTVVLGDFDVSRTAPGRAAMALQTSGIATNSVGYTAPEVMRAPSGQLPRATSKLDVFGVGCVIYHMHMYPRVLPEPETICDDVASQAGLFESTSSDLLAECTVTAWAEAVPRHAIVGATRANPIARLSPRQLLQTEYMRTAGEYVATNVQRPAHWQYQEHAGSWLVRESPEIVARVERLLNDTAQPKEHSFLSWSSPGGDSVRLKVTSVQRVENLQVWSAYASRRQALADVLAREGYVLPRSARNLLTSEWLYPLAVDTLESAASEVFLFHSTSKPDSIALSGFDACSSYAGAVTGGVFERGVYFAESASKSDLFVSPSEGKTLTLIVARVCLGRCKVVERGRSYSPEGKSEGVSPRCGDTWSASRSNPSWDQL